MKKEIKKGIYILKARLHSKVDNIPALVFVKVFEISPVKPEVEVHLVGQPSQTLFLANRDELIECSNC